MIGRGGETNLHAHTHMDGMWFVLSGSLRFYSDETTIAGELGRYEGILIPRGAQYWFEQVGEEPVEVLQIECSDRPMTKDEARAERADLNNVGFVPLPLAPFKYEFPEFNGKRAITWLAKTDRLFADVQVIGEGGETNLHAHPHLDGIWFVLSGKLKFYSDETTLMGELGRHAGVVVPRGAPYWFEASGDEPVEVFQLECSDVPFTLEQARSDRLDIKGSKRDLR